MSNDVITVLFPKPITDRQTCHFGAGITMPIISLDHGQTWQIIFYDDETDEVVVVDESYLTMCFCPHSAECLTQIAENLT